MAEEFNVTEEHEFFLGEDKAFDFTIVGPDGTTPVDMSALPLEWNMRKTDKAADPAILVKTIAADGTSDGIELVGIFDLDPALNTQRVRVVFSSSDTDALKANFAYRHSLKRLDTGNEAVLVYGSLTFLQATVR